MDVGDGRSLPDRPGGRRTSRRRRSPLAAALPALLVLCFLFGAVSPAGASSAPGKPVAKAPKGAITTSTPTFKWSKASGAAKYELRAYKGSRLLLKKTGITKLSWKSSKALPGKVGLTWKVRGTNARGKGAWSTSLTFKVVSIGTIYQGGEIAYILHSGDPGYVAGQTHGLIAAAADQSAGIWWYNGADTVTGATGTALGTGSANTTTIITVQGAVATTYAAGVARAYTNAGYNDWYLPSKDELNKLYLSQAALGGFVSVDYWSSSEGAANYALYQDFGTGDQGGSSKDGVLRVRAVRAF